MITQKKLKHGFSVYTDTADGLVFSGDFISAKGNITLCYLPDAEVMLFMRVPLAQLLATQKVIPDIESVYADTIVDSIILSLDSTTVAENETDLMDDYQHSKALRVNRPEKYASTAKRLPLTADNLATALAEIANY